MRVTEQEYAELLRRTSDELLRHTSAEFDTMAIVPYVDNGEVRTEDRHQAAVFEWAALNEKALPELDVMFHPANEGKRSPRYGAQKKREGLKRGVPDILLPVPNKKGFVGLAIELKRIDKNGRKTKVRPEQDRWLGRLRAYHWRTEVCYSAAEAIDTILDYLGAG